MPDRSSVYFRPARSYSQDTGLVASMLAAFDAAGLPDMIHHHDVVAIKVHCGEWDNTSYLRPVYARTLADRVKELGGRPFVTDTITLPYSARASRSSALDILTTAERNGYSSAVLGCPFIVADGFTGRDDVRVDLPEGYILEEAYVAAGIASADVLIALTHFKGHGIGMMGGSMKNLGIGCQSRRGKHNVHMGGHPLYSVGTSAEFHPEKCKGRNGCPRWELCEACCPWGLFHVSDTSITWEQERCTSCLGHLGANVWCGVVGRPSAAAWEATNAAIADACLAVVKTVGRDRVGFINMAIDIAPQCDCVNFSDTAMVPNVGVFASHDPVAIDAAAKDMVTESPGMPGSMSEDLELMEPGTKRMALVSGRASAVSEEIQINTGVRIGLGSRDYELIDIDPIEPERLRFPPDPRPTGTRFGRIQQGPMGSFPFDREGGRGFARKDEVDFSELR
jgi:uncharacterized Fe-S center protein